MKQELVFLKLGGSVITDKDQVNTADLARIERFAAEIARARVDQPNLTILVGHGSGSFGHHAASQYHTREGVHSPVDWQGFSVVGERARALNQTLIQLFVNAHLPVVSFSPCSMVLADNRAIIRWDLSGIQLALQQNLIPVIYGDVIFDQSLGGTILSTEDLFTHLAPILRPSRIALAGFEEGVWQDFPARLNLVKNITPGNQSEIDPIIGSSKSLDVTGGMRSKVGAMLALVEKGHTAEVQIFSGIEPGSVYQVLMGSHLGTVIKNPKG